jgi:hypothetical protein
MRARCSVATLLLAVTLAGCADTTSSGAVDGPTDAPSTSSATSGQTSEEPSDEPSPDEEERCPYLTPEQVSEALGAPLVETAGSVHACFFDPEGAEEGDAEGASVMLSRVDVEINPVDYAAQTRALCLGEVTDVDAGDEAFACVMGLGPQGQMYAGRVLVTVNVMGAADDATGIGIAAALLPEVSVPPADH